MGKFHVELDSDGVQALLKSTEMIAACRSFADSIAGRAGSGYGVTTFIGKTRGNVSVAPMTAKAKKDNLKNNTLLKARGF